jgi:hypothetical protein
VHVIVKPLLEDSTSQIIRLAKRNLLDRPAQGLIRDARLLRSLGKPRSFERSF